MLAPQATIALRAIFAYARKYGVWPSSAEIAPKVKRDRRNVCRLLRKLESSNLVSMRWNGQESGWILTPCGLEAIGRKVAPAMKDGAPSRKVRNNQGKFIWHTRRKRLAERYKTLSELGPVEY